MMNGMHPRFYGGERGKEILSFVKRVPERGEDFLGLEIDKILGPCEHLLLERGKIKRVSPAL